TNAAGDKADVNVLGTAVAAGNQQSPSPNFTVSVLAAPFDLKAEPAALKVVQGDKARLKVTAARKAYQGPIELEVRNLPANVAAGKVTIPAGQTVVEVELAVAANAPPGDRPNLQVVGTAAGYKPVLAPAVAVTVHAPFTFKLPATLEIAPGAKAK